MFSRLRRFISSIGMVVISLALLTACGGSGGNDDNDSNTSTPAPSPIEPDLIAPVVEKLVLPDELYEHDQIELSWDDYVKVSDDGGVNNLRFEWIIASEDGGTAYVSVNESSPYKPKSSTRLLKVLPSLDKTKTIKVTLKVTDRDQQSTTRDAYLTVHPTDDRVGDHFNTSNYSWCFEKNNIQSSTLLESVKTLDCNLYPSLIANLAGFPKLEELTLKSYEREDIDVSGLTSLKKLDVEAEHATVTLPSDLSNLEVIKIYGKLPSSLQFGDAPNLRVLELSRPYSGYRPTISLSLGAAPKLEEWVIGNLTVDTLSLDLPSYENLARFSISYYGGQEIDFDFTSSTHLTDLTLSGSVIESVDLTGLSELVGLSLTGYGQKRLNLELDNTDNLKDLQLWGVELSSPLILTSDALETLNIKSTRFASGEKAALDLSALTNLREVVIGSASFNSIAFPQSNALKSVDIDSSGIEHIDLSGNNMLESIRISTDAQSIRLPNSDVLSVIELPSNELSELFIHNRSVVTTLKLHSNAFTDFPLDGFTQLSTLNLSNNTLSSLDLSALSELRRANATNNQIDNLLLPVATDSPLESLHLGSNRLTSIDISQTNIISLGVSNNQLTSANFPAFWSEPLNDSYRNLDISDNSLSSLWPDSMSPEFSELNFSNNSLTTFPNVSKVSERLDASGNAYTSVQNWLDVPLENWPNSTYRPFYIGYSSLTEVGCDEVVQLVENYNTKYSKSVALPERCQ